MKYTFRLNIKYEIQIKPADIGLVRSAKTFTQQMPERDAKFRISPCAT